MVQRKRHQNAADAIRTPANDVCSSAASVWEVVTKYRLGRLPLPEPPERLIPTERKLRGVAALAFDEDAALQALRLALGPSRVVNNQVVALNAVPAE